MYAKEVTINNPTGLHARPATQLVRDAEKYQSEIRIIKENLVINPKSIFKVRYGQRDFPRESPSQ